MFDVEQRREDIGFLLGLLVGEGSFSGDGRQPQINLRMHIRHKGTFDWLMQTFPGGKLYGPYLHGGRNYYQWIARGPYLREVLVPIVREHSRYLDDHVFGRFLQMCQRYGIATEPRENWE